jgi:transcription-repair coupling factor (superfamily II helicase)
MISYETNVVGFSEELIRDAISMRFNAIGQVFFINNRIENIKEVAGMIQRLVPNARVGIGMDRWKEEAGRIDVGFHERRI